MTVSPDQAWSVNGPKQPPAPPAPGTVPDPMSDFIKKAVAGRTRKKPRRTLVNTFRRGERPLAGL